MKSYLFCFILESAVVQSELEVVLRCENYVQVDALTVVNALCGLALISLLMSRAGCYSSRFSLLVILIIKIH